MNAVRCVAVGTCLATLLAASIARAQTADNAATAKLIASARAGTMRYQNSNNAIADGFKRVGVEFPAMGEHWVNLPRILENHFDPARPSVLIYVTMHGTRQLAGVGYTALLTNDQPPPSTAAKRSDWHEHNGSVIDESLPVHGGRGGSAHTASMPELDGTRLAILHAWVWTKNPAGTFVTENWSLPQLRAGLTAHALAADAVRGLSLADDDALYYEQTLDTSLQLSDADATRMHTAVGDARRVAHAALSDRSAGENAALATAWTSLWTSLEKTLPKRVADLRSIRAKL